MKVTQYIKDLGLEPKSKLLVIMPHPDDESAFAAGFIYQASQVTEEVYVLSLTCGEKSSLRCGMTKNQDLGVVRQKELEKACRILEASTMICGGFEDGALEFDQKGVLKFLMKECSSIAPTHVLTLEPDGVYGHPDHIALSQMVFKLYQLYKPQFKLIYATVPGYFRPSSGASRMARKPQIQPLLPHVCLELSLVDQYIKVQSLLAHHSQMGKNSSFWRRWQQYGLLTREYFCLV